MEDQQIIDLYNARCEQAISETDRKYGSFCRQLALSILTIREDAEECVSDTYFTVWNKIPPELPRSLRAFLGRITRNLCISRYRANHAQKRYSGMDLLLSELNDCVPAPKTTEELADSRRLGELISQWLDTLSAEDRVLFVRRYWYGDALRDLALEAGCGTNQLAHRMLRLRSRLRAALEAEGVGI